MLVKAIQGGKYPVQGKPGQYITESRPMDVPNNQYYRRAISGGSLVLCEIEEPKPKKSKKREASPQGEDKE